MIHSSLASAQHFSTYIKKHAKQASKVLQYSFVVSLLSGNQVNINITFFEGKSTFAANCTTFCVII